MVALNQTSKGRISGVVDPLFPDGVPLPRLATSRMQAQGRKLRVLRRVTVVLQEASEAYALVSRPARGAGATPARVGVGVARSQGLWGNDWAAPGESGGGVAIIRKAEECFSKRLTIVP